MADSNTDDLNDADLDALLYELITADDDYDEYPDPDDISTDDLDALDPNDDAYLDALDDLDRHQHRYRDTRRTHTMADTTLCIRNGNFFTHFYRDRPDLLKRDHHSDPLDHCCDARYRVIVEQRGEPVFDNPDNELTGDDAKHDEQPDADEQRFDAYRLGFLDGVYRGRHLDE